MRREAQGSLEGDRLIYLCRHGQTEFNRDRRLQGRLDSPLTPEGVRQAAAMAKLLHEEAPDPTSTGWEIISSPLLRALKTAEIISEGLGLRVVVDERLAEISLGDWEGQRADDLRQGRLDLRDDPEWFAHAPGGETYGEVRQRVCAFLDDVGPEPGRRLIVVSHGVTGRVLRGVYAHLSKAQTLAQDAPQNAVFRLSAAGSSGSRAPRQSQHFRILRANKGRWRKGRYPSNVLVLRLRRQSRFDIVVAGAVRGGS